MKRVLAAACLGLALANGAQAAIDTYEFSNDANRERFSELTRELRCPKCQNQDIADSNAPIATDLRRQIHEQLEAGRSNTQIVDYMVDRYGEFVRYKPPVEARTVLLWFGPAAALLGGILILALIVLRRRRAPGTLETGLSADERARLDELTAQLSRDKDSAP